MSLRRRQMVTQFIKFEDPEVERICVANWGRNGGITEEQAARVTAFGKVFKGNTLITRFNEAEYFTGVTSIGSEAFNECRSLAFISLPAGVTSFERLAFRSCVSLALTSLPAGVTRIGDYSFNGCQSLALTSLPAGVTSIGDSAFLNCRRLAFISLPAGVTSIGGGAFSGCTSIPYLHILPENPPTTGRSTFDNTSFKLYVGDGSSAEHDDDILAAYEATPNWSSYSSRLDTWYNYLNR